MHLAGRDAKPTRFAIINSLPTTPPRLSTFEMVLVSLSSRSSFGPRLFQMLLFLVALTFGFYVFTGKLAPVPPEYSLGLVFLEESYLLYFEPMSEKNPQQTLDNMKRYRKQYESIITYGLDGELGQQYDTLIVGFSFSLSYTEKVMKAIGLSEILSDVESSTMARLQKYLESHARDDLVKDNVRLLLEKDGEATIQA